jgi:uncharacterized membrane protein YidH (DUF202 family)
MKLIGIALVVLGIVALIIGVLGYSQEKTVIDMGGIKATATEHKTIPIAPIAGVVSLVGGVALLVVDKRRA